MTDHIAGIHHITAIAGDAQANLDFYVGVLGLRLVKRTVNFDDPGTYHFYFADYAGSPGTVLTFFPWPHVKRGLRGSGEVQATAFAVGPDSLGWWSDRLKRLGVDHRPVERLGEELIALEDHDGMRLELASSAAHSTLPADGRSALPSAHAIRGFHSATLAVAGFESTAQLLTATMGFSAAAAEHNRFRFIAAGPESAPGRLIDLLCTPEAPPAKLGGGSVHHIAYRTTDDAAQQRWRARLAQAGLNATPILDRQYFHSIYFREPGGVIFEFATEPPGFTTDEPLGALGRALKLPAWLEPRRTAIEGVLPRVTLPEPRR
jgi:glyoxalase family protein